MECHRVFWGDTIQAGRCPRRLIGAVADLRVTCQSTTGGEEAQRPGALSGSCAGESPIVLGAASSLSVVVAKRGFGFMKHVVVFIRKCP